MQTLNTVDKNPVIQRNIDTILFWLDAHNRQDMKALDCYTDDIEIIEMNTGAVHQGMKKMHELARLAYGRKGFKQLTHLFATETDACVEYIARADTSQPLTDEEKHSNMHGLDISKAKTIANSVEVPVCFICHFTEAGKIDRVREYWDSATMLRQFGIESLKSRLFGFLMQRAAK